MHSEGLIVNPLSSLGYYHLTFFAKPACDRKLFQQIKKSSCTSILEIGLADRQRSQQILRVAKKFSGGQLRYTGLDLFDAREDGSLKLIDMHKALKVPGVKTQLVPGCLQQSVKRIANSHADTDLVIVSAGYDKAELQAALPFFPRMLHANSVVMLQSKSDQPYKMLNRLDVERLVAQASSPAQDKAAKAA
jgi:hypothetical protein